MSVRDYAILRDLAERYREIAADPIMDMRRDLWRRHNSLKRTHTLIYVRAFGWQEMPQSRLHCADPFYRAYEDFFRQSLFRYTFKDDFISEPWVTVRAACVTPPEGVWGLASPRTHSAEARGSFVWDAPLKTESDIDRLIEPHHAIDEAETARRLEKLDDAIGDILTLSVDRQPAYVMWEGDISTQLAYLRGLEQMMWDMMDRPEWLHRLLAHMRDGILRTHEEAERAGDWSLIAHQNQAMPYVEELKDPTANGEPVDRKQLWIFMASQETTAVGPKQFEEFMLRYQIPIMAPFGLAAYGCCEDLTRKIEVLRQIPNLRRIAVSPMANVARCAAQIGQDYVLSYRPSPTDMVGYGFDETKVRDMLSRDLDACGDCHVDITLKDVETVQGDPDRIRRWVDVTREVIARQE
ncbi:MAG: hypothetical protein MUF84_16790 [Anaerolineae bacterium]|nr:hypothetical protein [Anaerolineae bacterium]